MSEMSDVLLRLFAITVSLSIHEAAHAWTAFRLGDDTAAREGRLTLNPMAHFDIVGTLMILFAPIGWAKPVPVNPNNLGNPSRDMSLVALAGPISNLVLAVLACGGYALMSLGTMDLGWHRLISTFITMNFALAVFNLLPVFPLDGSKALTLVLSKKTALRWDMASARFGLYPLIIIILWSSLLPGGPLAWWFAIWRPILNPIAGLFGVYGIF